MSPENEFHDRDLHSWLDDCDASDPNLHEMLGRLETLVDCQEERIQVLEGQLEWVQGRQALCPCIRSRTLASVREGLEEGASECSGEEVPTSSTSCPVSMTAVGSFRWGLEAGTAVGEAWGQELDEEDGVEDEDCQGYCLDLLVLLWRTGDVGRAKGEERNEGCWRRIIGRKLGF